MANEFNRAVAAIEEAQSEIRLIVKNAYMYGWNKATTNKQLKAAIDKATSGIKIERLKGDIEKSLWNFANKQRIIWQQSVLSPAVLYAVTLAMNGKPTAPAERRFSLSDNKVFDVLTYEQRQTGVPLEQFYSDVWREKVKPTLDKLCDINALDPNDFSGRNSLRNLAEMEVRYQEHKDNVQDLRQLGVKIVICSAHADCSERCKPYQGRLYSLDGSRGTVDGKPYVPLEEATQNPADQYTTKAGRVYQNGLLGFNCRHKLYEYRGQAVPMVNEADRKREYAITKKQRELERQVRQARIKAIMSDNAVYSKKMRVLAKDRYREYTEFCKKNNRAFYPIRITI